MATAWDSSIQRGGVLTVFTEPTVSGVWKAALATAIVRFNDLSNKLSLGVTYTTSSAPPDPNGMGGANVNFQTANGAFTINAMGQQVALTMPGKADLGKTFPVVVPNGGCVKAFIVVPALTQHHNFMKTCMVVHELIHATGLDNSDHSSDGDPDIFCSSLAESGSGVQCGLFANRVMPPIWMTIRTAQKIQTLWP